MPKKPPALLCVQVLEPDFVAEAPQNGGIQFVHQVGRGKENAVWFKSSEHF